ncbi:MAG: hypothetical protein QW680_07940 [Pyrobaculum sp.]
MSSNCREFLDAILGWEGGRRFPWRGETDPYRIVVTEVLLIRTRRDAVARVYDRFFERFPTPCDLARADVAEILSVVGSLGLAKRAVYLKSLGEVLCREGVTPESLRKAKGVGPYVRSVLLLRLYGEGAVAVDRNGGRLLFRYLAGRDPGDKPELHPLVTEFVERCLNKLDARARLRVTYALMDLGFEVCRARGPGCDVCPLKTSCRYPTSSRRCRSVC